MYSLSNIIAQNQRAEAAGVFAPGSVVGTTGYLPPSERPEETPAWSVDGQPVLGHREDDGGLRGHSIGDTYPWQVVGGIDDSGNATWTVSNYATGAQGFTYAGLPANPHGCTLAHDEAALRKAGVSLQGPVTIRIRNEEY